MNFMKDRQGECLGKILHLDRVWKVYKQRFLEHTKLAIGRTLKSTSAFARQDLELACDWRAVQRVGSVGSVCTFRGRIDSQTICH